METMEAIRRRKSTRTFDPAQEVPEELVTRVLEAGCLAPIAGKFGESLHLTVCTDRELIGEINALLKASMGVDMDFSYGAPVVIFVSASPEQMMPGIEIPNTACVIENMLLAATDAGLANIYLWGGAQALAKSPELCAKFGIPEGFTPISAAAIGYDINGEAQPKDLAITLGVNYI